MIRSSTVMMYGATLSTNDASFFSLPTLTKIGKDAVKKAGLGLRRVVCEKYKGVEGAMTIIFFLNESHLVLTTYPEAGTLELELATCKWISLTKLVHMLSTLQGFQMISSFSLDRPVKETRWLQGFM